MDFRSKETTNRVGGGGESCNNIKLCAKIQPNRKAEAQRSYAHAALNYKTDREPVLATALGPLAAAVCSESVLT